MAIGCSGPSARRSLERWTCSALCAVGGGASAPQLVDEPLGGHDIVPVGEQENGQQHALLGRPELDRALRAGHAERPEDGKVKRFTHALPGRIQGPRTLSAMTRSGRNAS